MVFGVHEKAESVYGFGLYGGYDFNKIRYIVEAYTHNLLGYAAVLCILIISIF